MNRHQICITVDDTLLKELEKLKKETGLSFSRIIELKFKGYKIEKVN